jgi:hypothetical protein
MYENLYHYLERARAVLPPISFSTFFRDAFLKFFSHKIGLIKAKKCKIRDARAHLLTLLYCNQELYIIFSFSPIFLVYLYFLHTFGFQK